MSHLSHLSIKVDFPNPLSPATIKVNSNPEIVRASFNFSIGDKTQKYFKVCQLNTKVLEKFSSHLFWQISCAPGWASLRNPHTHLVAETIVVNKSSWGSEGQLLPELRPSSNRRRLTWSCIGSLSAKGERFWKCGISNFLSCLWCPEEGTLSRGRTRSSQIPQTVFWRFKPDKDQLKHPWKVSLGWGV